MSNENLDPKSVNLTAALETVKSGDTRAYEQLVESLGGIVLTVIRRRMSQRVRRYFDSQDFSQAVWASFYQDREKIQSLEDAQQLRKYICAIARNKVVDQMRRVEGSGRTTDSPAPLSESEVEEAFSKVLDVGSATASTMFRLEEEWNELTHQCSDSDRRVLEMREKDYTMKQIAEELNLSSKSVQRVMDRFRRRWKSMEGDSHSDT